MTVLITYPHSATVGQNFQYSLLRTAVEHRDLIEEIVSMRCYSGDSLIEGRNESMRIWLDEFKSEYLWTIDTDIGFRPEILPALLSHNAPVVSALYRTVYEDGRSTTGAPGDWRIIPAAYQWTDSGAMPINSPEPGVMRVGAVGGGCLLIRRDAALKVRDRYGDNWWSIIRPPSLKKINLGEDFSLCWRLKQCRIPILLDSTVHTTHRKSVWV